ncbi:MAG: hypothetical protein D6677_08785 [Calditrichaeota bacterium]|nr:MAG: hypothetical protein D6677_08785 [Calditrichota bacterium]
MTFILFYPLLITAQTTYTPAFGSGDWKQSSTWNPTGIPGARDTVIINSGEITINTGDTASVGALLFSGLAVINNNGLLYIHKNFQWQGGKIYGSGRIVIEDSAMVLIEGRDEKGFAGTMENNGTFIVREGSIGFYENSTFFINRHVLELYNNGTIGGFQWGEMQNEGVLIKRDSLNATTPSTTHLETIFTNMGRINIINGTLDLALHSTIRDSVYISSGATLSASYGTHIIDNPVLSGAGTFSTQGGIFRVNGTPLRFADSMIVQLENDGQLVGNADISIAGTLKWHGGVLSDSATVTLLKNAHCEIDSSEIKWILGTVNNVTEIEWKKGSVNFGFDGVFRNFGTIHLMAGAYDTWGNNAGWFYNAGTLHQAGGHQNLFSPVTLENAGKILIDHNGVLTCQAGLYNDSTGWIQGAGVLEIYDYFQQNDGHIAPDGPPDTLTVTGRFPLSAHSVFNVDIGGYFAGEDHDLLQIDGSAELAGTMRVAFTAPFVPQEGDSFVVMTYQSTTGQFDTLVCADSFLCHIAYRPDRAVLYVDGQITGIREAPPVALPTHIRLYPNYPNPFNPATTLRYDLPRRQRVRIDIFNTAGQRVRLLVNRVHEPGRHEISWDGRNDAQRMLPSGIYYYRFRAGTSVYNGRMMLLK